MTKTLIKYIITDAAIEHMFKRICKNFGINKEKKISYHDIKYDPVKYIEMTFKQLVPNNNRRENKYGARIPHEDMRDIIITSVHGDDINMSALDNEGRTMIFSLLEGEYLVPC